MVNGGIVCHACSGCNSHLFSDEVLQLETQLKMLQHAVAPAKYTVREHKYGLGFNELFIRLRRLVRC